MLWRLWRALAEILVVGCIVHRVGCFLAGFIARADRLVIIAFDELFVGIFVVGIMF